jgi:hypothetical protein
MQPAANRDLSMVTEVPIGNSIVDFLIINVMADRL